MVNRLADPESRPTDPAEPPLNRHFARFRPILTNPRVRGEIGWVGVQKVGEFALQLVTLKVLTGLLSQEAFGELQLAITGLLLIANLLIMPMRNAYLRVFHRAEEAGAARQAALAAIRWHSVATGAVCLLGALLTWPASRWFGLEPFSVLAAGALFVGNQWRMLALFVANVQRNRRSATAQVLGNLLLQIGLAVLLIAMAGNFATAVLIAYATSTLFFAVAFGFPLFKRILSERGGGSIDLHRTVMTFGVPFGVLLTFQWVQGFTDRYVLAAHVDKEAAAVYIAAFQVCGVPFMLMYFFLEALLTPIMYQRAKDKDDPRQLWSAYRIFLGGVGLYIVVGFASIVALSLGGHWLLVSLTTEAYALPVATIVVLSFARFAQCLTFLFDRVFTVNQTMATSLILRGAMALLTIPICWGSIRAAGLHGAAVSAFGLGVLHLILQAGVPRGCVPTMLSAYRQTRGMVSARRPDSVGDTR